MALLQVPIGNLIANKVNEHKNANKTKLCKEIEIKKILSVYEQHLEKVVAIMKGDPLAETEKVEPSQTFTDGTQKLDSGTIHRKLIFWCRYIFFGLYLASITVLLAVFA